MLKDLEDLEQPERDPALFLSSYSNPLSLMILLQRPFGIDITDFSLINGFILVASFVFSNLILWQAS
jgi:hypothetical protein